MLGPHSRCQLEKHRVVFLILRQSAINQKLNSDHFQSHRAPPSFFTLLLGENVYGSTIRQHGDLEES